MDTEDAESIHKYMYYFPQYFIMEQWKMFCKCSKWRFKINWNIKHGGGGGGGAYKIMKKTNFPRVEPLRLFTCYLEIINVHDTIKINSVAICLRLSHILRLDYTVALKGQVEKSPFREIISHVREIISHVREIICRVREIEIIRRDTK